MYLFCKNISQGKLYEHGYIQLLFYKQPVYKELALGWQIAKQLSEFNPLLSLSNNKN